MGPLGDGQDQDFTNPACSNEINAPQRIEHFLSARKISRLGEMLTNLGSEGLKL